MASSVFFLKVFHFRLELRLGNKVDTEHEEGHTLPAVEPTGVSLLEETEAKTVESEDLDTHTTWSLPGFQGFCFLASFSWFI